MHKKITLGLIILTLIFFSSWTHCEYGIPILGRAINRDFACANLVFPTYLIPFFVTMIAVVAWPFGKKKE